MRQKKLLGEDPPLLPQRNKSRAEPTAPRRTGAGFCEWTEEVLHEAGWPRMAWVCGARGTQAQGGG